MRDKVLPTRLPPERHSLAHGPCHAALAPLCPPFQFEGAAHVLGVFQFPDVLELSCLRHDARLTTLIAQRVSHLSTPVTWGASFCYSRKQLVLWLERSSLCQPALPTVRQMLASFGSMRSKLPFLPAASDRNWNAEMFRALQSLGRRRHPGAVASQALAIALLLISKQ